MKNYTNAILSVLLPAVSLVACTEKIEDGATLSGEARTIEVSVDVDIDGVNHAGVPSKATWADGEGLQWASDESGAFGLADDKGTNGNAESFSLGSDGRATFTGSVDEAATRFLPYYPKVGAAGGNSGDITVNFPIASVQTQTEAGVVDVSSDRIALTGVAPVTLGAEVSYSATMKMQSSMARFIIYSTTGSSESVKSVSLTVPDDVKISGLWVVVQPWNGESRAFVAGDQESTVTVNLTAPYDLSGIVTKDDAQGIYMGLCPAKTTGCTYVVTTDKGTYTFESSKVKEFNAGTIHNIALNLDKGVFSSTADDVVFFPNGSDSPASQNVNSDQNTLYLGATTATYGGNAVTMNPDDCVLVSVNPDGSDASGWASASWENTNNYNLRIVIAKNRTTSDRSCKVYMDYKGIRSKNYISVHQDPGSGLPVIVPALNETFDGEISYAGEIIEAASLELAVDGSVVSGADVDEYVSDEKYGITVSCGGGASVVCKSGVIKLTVPENTSSVSRTFKLVVKTQDGSAELSFTQAANPGGETPAHTFQYTIRANYPETDKPGFGSASASWQLYHFSNVVIDDIAYPAGNMTEIPEDLQNALVEHALALVDLETEDIGGQTGPQYTAEEMREFVSFTPVVDAGAEMHVNVNLTANDTGKYRNFKIRSCNSDGTVYQTNLYFQVP